MALRPIGFDGVVPTDRGVRMANFGNTRWLETQAESVHAACVAVQNSHLRPHHSRRRFVARRLVLIAITNPMELSLSSEAASFVATQEFLDII
jgi:hypothetical protein